MYIFTTLTVLFTVYSALFTVLLTCHIYSGHDRQEWNQSSVGRVQTSRRQAVMQTSEPVIHPPPLRGRPC